MMKRALIVCILVSCVAALHAESKVVTFPLPLQPNEEVVRLSGNPDFYTAVTKLTIKGIVPKVEYWVVTSAGRMGPFSDVPTTSADEYPHIRSFFATYEDEGKDYVVYGPNKPGTTMGSIAEQKLGPYGTPLIEFLISADGRRWAAVVKSRLKPEAFDIITDKGVLDWFSDPILVGFTADNTLLYWTRKVVPGSSEETMTFWNEKVKLFSKQFDFHVYGYSLPATYLSPDGNEWGWAEYIKERAETTSFNVNFAGGKKKIKFQSDDTVYHIMPDGQVLHGGGDLYLDGVNTGMDGKVLAVSPDKKRVAIQVGKRILVDELEFDLSKDTKHSTFFFSADSRHFISRNEDNGEELLDNKKIMGPDAALKATYQLIINQQAERLRFISESDFKAEVGELNLRTLKFATLIYNMKYPDSTEPIVGYIIGDTYFPCTSVVEPYPYMKPKISDDGKVLAFLSENGELIVNGEKVFNLYNKRIDSNPDLGIESMSPDGSESQSRGQKGVHIEGQLYPGNFFGKDPVKYPEGSIKYKDGAVVVTTW